MTEISTEELAQWLEYISQWTLQHASEKNSVYHLPMDVVDIAKISQAAARLRALAEDAERLDWLETCDAQWMLAGNYGHLSYVRNIRGVDQRVDRQGNNLRQAIDNARHD